MEKIFGNNFACLDTFKLNRGIEKNEIIIDQLRISYRSFIFN